MLKLLLIENKTVDALLLKTFLKGSKKEEFEVTVLEDVSNISQEHMQEADLVILASHQSNYKTALDKLKAIKDLPIIIAANSYDPITTTSLEEIGASDFIFKNKIQVKALIDQLIRIAGDANLVQLQCDQ
jgi:DNA-binding response OmpR family regulator